MKPITFTYKNHRGETAVRNMTPTSLDFMGHVGYDYQPGWFLTGYDHDKKATRSFRLSHIILDEPSAKTLLARLVFRE